MRFKNFSPIFSRQSLYYTIILALVLHTPAKAQENNLRKALIYQNYLEGYTFPAGLERSTIGWTWRIVAHRCGGQPQKILAWAHVPEPSVDPPKILQAEALINAERFGCLLQLKYAEPVNKHGLIAWYDRRAWYDKRDAYGRVYITTQGLNLWSKLIPDRFDVYVPTQSDYDSALGDQK